MSWNSFPGCLPEWKEISGEEKILSGRPLPFPLGERDVVYMSNPGGGYGDPLERYPSQVLKDVQDGYVSPEKAGADYGVVIDLESKAVDAEATKRLRDLKSRVPPTGSIPDSQAGVVTDEIIQD